MFTLLFQHRNFMISILLLLSLSIICQIIMGVIYHRLIWETENMSTTNNKALQQLKLKFSSCSKINERVSNVSIFVDKFMNQIKIGCIPLTFLKHLSGQLMLLAILVAGIGACLGISRGENFFTIIPFYVISFLGLYCYFAVSSLIDIPSKTKILRTNLVDYLENHMAGRLKQTQSDMQLINMDEPDDTASSKNKSILSTENAKNPNTQPDTQNSPAFSKSEAEELENLLKEFLT